MFDDEFRDSIKELKGMVERMVEDTRRLTGTGAGATTTKTPTPKTPTKAQKRRPCVVETRYIDGDRVFIIEGKEPGTVEVYRQNDIVAKINTIFQFNKSTYNKDGAAEALARILRGFRESDNFWLRDMGKKEKYDDLVFQLRKVGDGLDAKQSALKNEANLRLIKTAYDTEIKKAQKLIKKTEQKPEHNILSDTGKVWMNNQSKDTGRPEDSGKP